MLGIKLDFFTVEFSTKSRAIGKSLIWLGVTGVIGGLPILLIWMLSGMHIQQADDKLKEIIHDLAVPFLCCAIITEISIEAFLCKIKFSKYSYLSFFLAAGIVIFLVCFLYVVTFILKSENLVKPGQIGIYQVIIISFTILYSLFIKTVMFIEEQRAFEKCRSYDKQIKN